MLIDAVNNMADNQFQAELAVWAKPWSAHGADFAVATAAWWIIYWVSRYSISLFGNVPKSDSEMLATRVVCLLHSIAAVGLALFALLEPNSPLLLDHVHGVSASGTFLMILSSG